MFLIVSGKKIKYNKQGSLWENKQTKTIFRINFYLPEWIRSPGKLHLGTEELIIADNSLRILRAQELSPCVRNQSRKAWLRKDLLVKLRCKKEMHRQWKQGHVALLRVQGCCLDVQGSGKPRRRWN